MICRTTRVCVVCLTAALCLLQGKAGLAGAYRVIALTGDPAPMSDRVFQSFGTPLLNAAGETAFQATLSGPPTDVTPHGDFLGSASGVDALALAGQPADGGVRFRTPGPPIILTNDRQTLFYGALMNEFGANPQNDYGIWAGPPNDVRVIARRGEQAPGLPAGVNYNLFFARPSATGVVGISASLQGPGIDDSNANAAYVGAMSPPGALELIAQSGDLAPGLLTNSRFVGFGAPAVNAAGQYLLPATATLGPGAFANGLWGKSDGPLQLLVSTETPAPDADGRHLTNIQEPGFNHVGGFVFQGNLAAASPQQYLSDVGIWAGDIAGGALTTVALEGAAAAEFAPDAVFHGSSPGEEPFYRAFSSPVLAGDGRVAFTGSVIGASIDFDHNDGVWISDPGKIGEERTRAVIAREGDQATESPEGTRFLGQNFGEDLISAFERPLITTNGQVAFEASTSGPLGDVGRGIWAQDRHGALHLIAHTGNVWEVAPGDLRTISLVKLQAGGSGDDGYLSAINGAGQLAFSLSFTDGTEAVIVASLQPGDTDADGDVDLADLNNVRNGFGGAGLGDTNHDGVVDLVDLNAVRNYFGDGTGVAAVPEPSTSVLLMVCSAVGFVITAWRSPSRWRSLGGALATALVFQAQAMSATLYWTTYRFDPADPANIHGEVFGLHRADVGDISGTQQELIHQLGYQPEYNALAAHGGAAFALEFFNHTQHDYAFEGPADLTPATGAELIGAAIDSAGNTYVADPVTGVIRRGDFEYENQVNFIDTGRDFQPSLVVALDEPRGMIYWAGGRGGGPLIIGRAKLDGTGIEELPINVAFDDYPVDLAIDSLAGKLYWTNSPAGSIQRANLDGSEIEDVVTGVLAFSLALDAHPVPEPSALALMLLGGLVLTGTLFRR